MSTTFARLSDTRKFVVCGQCDTVLCRRDRITMDGGTTFVHVLYWGQDWRPGGDHLERTGWHRIAEGDGPTRKGEGRAITGRPILTERAFPLALPVLCRCGVLNRTDPRRLDVVDIALAIDGPSA